MGLVVSTRKEPDKKLSSLSKTLVIMYGKRISKLMLDLQYWRWLTLPKTSSLFYKVLKSKTGISRHNKKSE